MYYEVEDFNALTRALHDMCARLEERLLSAQAVFDCRLIANELLSNVLQHDGGRAYCTVRLDGNALHLSVKGEREFVPPPVSFCPDVTCERGRGFFLVDTMSESRTYNSEDGICVVVRIDYR